MAAAFELADGQARLLAAQLADKAEPQSDGLIARRIKTVGRNDPCPNHTDVKFKNCECYTTLKTRALIPYRVARQMQGAKKK